MSQIQHPKEILLELARDKTFRSDVLAYLFRRQHLLHEFDIAMWARLSEYLKYLDETGGDLRGVISDLLPVSADTGIVRTLHLYLVKRRAFARHVNVVEVTYPSYGHGQQGQASIGEYGDTFGVEIGLSHVIDTARHIHHMWLVGIEQNYTRDQFSGHDIISKHIEAAYLFFRTNFSQQHGDWLIEIVHAYDIPTEAPPATEVVARRQEMGL